jgi:hypothetical protein
MTLDFNIATIHWADFEALLAAEWSKVTSDRSSFVSSAKKRRPRAAPGITPRGLSRRGAAALTGLSPTAFDKARREGNYPGPTLPGGKYDRNLIEKAMDHLSALSDSASPESGDDSWNDFSQHMAKR